VDTKDQIESIEFAVPFPEYDVGPLPATPGEDISITFMNEVRRIRQEAYQWQEWALQEILHWQDKCQELERELMLTEADFENERSINVSIMQDKRGSWQ